MPRAPAYTYHCHAPLISQSVEIKRNAHKLHNYVCALVSRRFWAFGLPFGAMNGLGNFECKNHKGNLRKGRRRFKLTKANWLCEKSRFHFRNFVMTFRLFCFILLIAKVPKKPIQLCRYIFAFFKHGQNAQSIFKMSFNIGFNSVLCLCCIFITLLLIFHNKNDCWVHQTTFSNLHK